MPVDLTRFDFNVHRFMNSYSVEKMDAEEVGQYLLLLCKSWAMGKNATLPDDSDFLSDVARVSVVSDKVMENFPLVETDKGPMRQNPFLATLWKEAVERCNQGMESVAKRGGKWAETVELKKSEAPYIGPYKEASRSEIPNPTRTDPNQSDSSIKEQSRIYKKPIGLDMFVKSVKRLLDFCDDPKYLKDLYKSLADRFDINSVYDKLDPWILKNKGTAYPLRDFFRAAPKLMLSAIEEASEHHDLDGLCAHIFEKCGYAPTGPSRSSLNDLIQTIGRKELEACFKECQDGAPEKEEAKWTLHNFCQGGAKVIALARKTRSAALQRTQNQIEQEMSRLRQEGEQESADFAAKESEEAKLAEESLEFFLTDGDAAEETVAGATIGTLDG